MRAQRLVAVLPLLAFGCGGEPPVVTCTSSGRTIASVVTFATFGKQHDDKSVEGLNVDGRISDGNDPEGCYQVDFVSPEGTPGIDNQVATLLPIVEGLVGKDNIDQLLGAAISNGQLILLMALRGVDDLENDACVDVTFGAGAGTPLQDGTGKYLPYQTFAWDAATAPITVVAGARIDGGVLTAGPGDVVLPVRVLDAAFNLGVHQTAIRMNVTPDDLGPGASLGGFVGGGIVVEELAQVIQSFNVGGSVKGAVVPLLKTRADLGVNAEGTCTQISAALHFETTPSFILGE